MNVKFFIDESKIFVKSQRELLVEGSAKGRDLQEMG